MKRSLAPFLLSTVLLLSVPCFANVFNLGPGRTNLEAVSVGDLGNAADTSSHSGNPAGQGSVSYTYNIGKYEVTAAQYCDFLNHVAATDTYGLYNSYMSDTGDRRGCNIQRSGSSGSFAYTVASDWANRPVNYVSFWDACRFANWLHNGQPTGLQSALTTEDGAYYINGYNGGDGRTIQRKASWRWALTSEDEWYKAAYYKGGTSNAYWDYPTQCSAPTIPSNDLVDPDPGNNANFNQTGYTLDSPYWRTGVGEFEYSGSHYNTYDQGGNVWELNEAVIFISTYVNRGLRGGSFLNIGNNMRSSYRTSYYPTTESYNAGFRVVQGVPEPSSLVVLGSGILALAGLIRRRR